MLSLTDPAAPDPCPAAFNLARYVLAPAETRPDHVALMVLGASGAERWSYGRLAAAVGGVATGLAARGLSAGDRVLLRLGNGTAFPLAFLGAVAGGFVPVPTAAGLTSGEVARLCTAIRPALIVAGAGVAMPDAPPCPVLAEAALAAFATLPPLPITRPRSSSPTVISKTRSPSSSSSSTSTASGSSTRARVM